MDLFDKAKKLANDATDKVSSLTESAKDAMATKTEFIVLNSTGSDLQKELNDLLVTWKTVDVQALSAVCIVKVTK